MIKLNESKLCIVEVMVVVVRRGDNRVEGLLSLLGFSVFATLDDEINGNLQRPICESKNPVGQFVSGAHELHIYLSHVP